MKEKTLKKRIKEKGYMLSFIAKKVGATSQDLTWALSKKRRSKRYKKILLDIEAILKEPTKE